METISLTIDGTSIRAAAGETILQAARSAGIAIPTLCHFDGLSDVGSCRLCLIELDADGPMLPACATRVTAGMNVQTESNRIRVHRRTVVELMFAGGNHACAICVANGHCELQDAAVEVGMDHVRFEYSHPLLAVDLSHELFGLDQNRCILCTRCVRVCDEIEGAHTWGVSGRGAGTRVLTDLGQPWGESPTCTSCGKCVMVCPTGALFHRGDTNSSLKHNSERLASLIASRESPP